MEEKIISKEELIKLINNKFPEAEIHDETELFTIEDFIFLKTSSANNFTLLGDMLVLRVFFPNNEYGASIIRRHGSYGAEKGLFELAVIEGYLEDWNLNFDNGIIDDVVGNLDSNELLNILDRIKNISEFL